MVYPKIIIHKEKIMGRFKLDETAIFDLPEWFQRYKSSAALLNVCSNYQTFSEIRKRAELV